MQSTNLSAFSKTYVHDAKYLLLGRSDVFSRHQLKLSRKEIWPNSNRVILGSLAYPTRHLAVSTAAVREGVTSKSDHDALSKKALYAFRVVTSEEMLSGLSEPTAGIQVGVIGEDNGSALIQRIGRAEHSWSNGRPPDGWGFFEAGSVDESFWIGPEINPVAALWLAPEAGRWLVAEARLLVCPLDASVAYEFDDKVVDEEDWKTAGEEDRVDVNNQLGSGTLYVFEGRSDPIEANRDLSALELKPKAVFERIPSPVSQPVSRCSDSLDSLTDTKDSAPAFATIHTISRDAITQALSWGMPNSISAEEVELKRMQGLKEYIDLKQWLLTTTGLLVGLGTISAYAVGGIEVAQGYGVGGVAGSVYFYNLQRRVDSIPRQSASQAALHDGQKQEFGDIHSVQREKWVNSGIIVNQGGRVLLIAIVAACLQSVKWSEIQIQPLQLLCGLLGFVSFKVALGLSVFRQK